MSLESDHGFTASISGTQNANPSANLFVERRKQDHVDNTIRRPSITYWQDAWMRIRKNKVAMAAGAYIVCLSLSALIIPEVIEYKYDQQEIWNAHTSPQWSGEEALVVAGSGTNYEPIVLDPPPAADSTFTTDPPTGSPVNLRLMGPALTVGAAMTWDQMPGVDGYRVYRSVSKDTLGVPLDDLGSEELSFLDSTSLTSGESYYYFVTAFNAFGDGPPSQALEVKPRTALQLGDALKIDPNAKLGESITTKPHIFGTDYLGRDLLARIMVGARISLFIGFGAPIIYVLIGIIYGSIAGYFGGLIDDFMMRITDIVATVPELLVVILLQVMMGSGVTTLLIALVAVAWARSARQIRGEVLRLREMEFVQAAIVLGTPFHKIVFRHLLPNVMGTVLVVLTLAVPSAIFTEAFLSFIGLGIAPPMASWGTVTRDGAKVFLTYPHELIIPSIMICATMLAFNLFGDGLRDALDPKMRGTQ
jgi:oligopeptide transport system permease protein